MPLAGFDPLVAEWFERRFKRPTDPQLAGWPEIRSGRDVLISAPTGSGKTLAAFLICLDTLIKRARAGELADETAAVYVSPLKALSNDIRKNLETPLAEIRELAEQRGVKLQPIRTAVRTGDTTAWERRRMTGKPPHILVTTPESLFILLTANGGREMLKTARTAIVDEIHAVADDKRGSHLALTLARLERLAAQAQGLPEGSAALQKIGLSATVKPLDEVARFLSARFEKGEGHIVQFGHRRRMDLAVEVPKDELGPVASNEQWEEIYDRLAELIRGHRTTLIFVNTRRLADRVAHRLAERLGEDAVLPHHGSLSRKLRIEAEQRLKEGQLKAVVATASLELGIDVGSVELVCQIGSPRSIAIALQRAGRSGHWVGALPKSRFFAMTRDELIECAALVRAIRRGDLDRLEIPRAPLDVLAQQIVAAVACEDYAEDELFELVRRAYSYRELDRKDFDAVVEMLSEGIATSRGRSGAYLHRDLVNRQLKARRGARLAAITSGGAIPDSAQYAVVAEPEGTVVGTLDEDFAVESNAGDVFLLGTTSWRIRRVEQGRVRVEDAHGAAPTLPFWRGEAPGRTFELSEEVSRLREEIFARAANLSRGSDERPVRDFLLNECGLDRLGAEQAAEYVRAGAAALGALPTQRRIVAERFFDEAGGMQLVIHAPFGSRINRAWGLALRKRFCRSFNLELQAAATDDGIVISLTEQHAFPLELVFEFLRAETLEPVLTQAMLPSPMFAARWRWNCSRALAILRFTGGRKVPPPIQRMRTDDLLAAVFPDQAACAENLSGEIRIPDHPLVKETIGDCLHEAMDLDGLKRVIEGIAEARIDTVAIDTPEPSPFSHEILNSNPYAYLDDAPLEERRARAVQMRRTLAPEMAGSAAALDPAAFEQVRQEAWPLVRGPEELHDALLTLVVLPPQEPWRRFFEELAAQRRAGCLHVAGQPFWVAAERLLLAQAVYPEARLDPAVEPVAPPRPLPETREACAAEVLRGWLDSTGPRSEKSLADELALPLDLARAALARLEGEGQILRGRFSPSAARDGPEWCNRRLLARVHRLTLGRLRKEIEPVSSAGFMRFLARWQHAAPGSRLHGVDGTLQVIKQLQGFEVPAAAWESHILPLHVAGYEPEFLDRLCLAGEVSWGRVSPHPAFAGEESASPSGGENASQTNGRRRRVRPTRAAPVTLFLREDADWLLAAGERLEGEQPGLSHPAREALETIETRGACFFADLVRTTGRLASEVEEALWELAAAGLVSADGFENLRALIDPKRRRGEGRGRTGRPRHAPGRWALLREPLHGLEEPGETQTLENFARLMLNRWGVVFRDLMQRESLAPPWRDLLVTLRRMEARGEIRGGRFVSAFRGEQFALPEAVDLLRAVRRSAPSGEEITVSASDPLNLAGVILPGPRISSASNEMLRLRDGVLAPPPQRGVLALAGQET